MPTEGISNQESSLSAENPPVMGDGSRSAEVQAAAPPVIGQPPVSVGVGPEDVPTPLSETIPPTLGATAAGDAENPSAVAQEVVAQQTSDIPAPQENSESSSPAESAPSAEVVPPEPSADGKSLDGVGAPPRAEETNPHKMKPHVLEATVGTGDDQPSSSSEPTPPPVPEDSNVESPEEASKPSFAPQENVSPVIPETISPGETAESPAVPEAEQGEGVISILDRIEKRNEEQRGDIDELKRRMQSPETATNQEAA